jgi:hypothetical protein
VRVLDAAFQPSLPDLHERAPGVVGSHVVVIFVCGVLERACAALDDVDELLELLEADGALAAAADGEGIFMVEGRGRG